jgi:glucan phosphoethanolaminetransferase (alkaline phosphatase superfamily)
MSLPVDVEAPGGRAAGRLPHPRWALLLAPTLLVVVADVALRGERLARLPLRYFASYAVAMLESAALWAALLCAASAARGVVRWFAAAALCAFGALAVGGQIYFYRQYAIYLNFDATLFGTSMADSVFGQLGADGRNFLSSVLPPMIGAAALIALGRRWLRPPASLSRLSALLSPLCLCAALLLPCSYRAAQGSTPDVIYFHAVGGLIKQLAGLGEAPRVGPARRAPPPLPALRAAPAAPRNVLLILTESLRADVACSEPAPRSRCPATPFTNDAAPGRVGLSQMRATSSTTAIQLAVLWTGLAPTAGRDALHRAPVVFDLAHAAGLDTAYWTSQHPMFANARLWAQDLPVRLHASATLLDPLADVDTGADDRLLTARAAREIATLREPFFAVVHYGNTHVPYVVDPTDAPFQPARASKAPEDNEEYRNHYLNAVHRQDRAVAELLAALRATPAGARTVVVYTSDHGEQFREHGQLGHTGSLFDEEIHVPAWIDAPEGTLAPAEREALAAWRETHAFHADVAVTLLDLVGVWGDPALAPHGGGVVGASLLRAPPAEERTIPLTNCAGVWSCAFESWGVMRGRRKLHAREWERAWRCYDVQVDPRERAPLPPEACADLAVEADRLFGGPPGGRERP